MSVAVDITNHIARNLILDLPGWYPEFLNNRPVTTEVVCREFRWSDHLIFTISDERKQHTINILVKILHDHGQRGRTDEQTISAQQRLKNEYQALESLHNALFQTNFPSISAIRPLTYYAIYNALVLEYVPCENMLSIIQKAGWFGVDKLRDLQVKRVAYESGLLLSMVHEIPKGLYPTAGDFDFYAFISLLSERIDTLSKLGADMRVLERLVCLDSTLTNLVNKNSRVTYTHLHGDYYPENIIQGSTGHIYTIDTPLIKVGPVEMDIAKFIVGLETNKQRLLYGTVGMKDAVLRAVVQSFLYGYQEQGNYNHIVLLLHKILASLQRWIEILEVVNQNKYCVIRTLLTKVRINPFMLNYLTKTLKELRKYTEDE
jgi:hypothetical protein